MELEIKGVGYKLRTLRKELGLKQEDLVKHKINTSSKDTPFTRNLVSMVETEKSPLTKKLAETIHQNIILACKEMNISHDFDFAEIILTPEEQTIRYINNYKNNLCTVLSLDESIKYGEKLLNLAESYHLMDELCKLYISLGDLTSPSDAEITLKYYSFAYVLKSELSADESLSLSRKLKVAYILLEKYEDSLNVAYDINSDNKDLLILCMSNDVLSLKKLLRYDEALTKLSELKPLLDSNYKDIKLKLQILEANTYLLQNNYNLASTIFKKLRGKKCSVEDNFLIEFNLLKLKIETNICELEDLNLFTENIPLCSLSSSDLTRYYDTLALGYTNFDKRKSVSYMVKAMNHITTQPKLTILNKEAFNLFIIELLTSEEKMKLFLDDFKEDFKLIIISSIKRNIIDENTLFKTLLYFQEKNDYKFVNSLIEKKIS